MSTISFAGLIDRLKRFTRHKAHSLSDVSTRVPLFMCVKRLVVIVIITQSLFIISARSFYVDIRFNVAIYMKEKISTLLFTRHKWRVWVTKFYSSAYKEIKPIAPSFCYCLLKGCGKSTRLPGSQQPHKILCWVFHPMLRKIILMLFTLHLNASLLLPSLILSYPSCLLI